MTVSVCPEMEIDADLASPVFVEIWNVMVAGPVPDGRGIATHAGTVETFQGQLRPVERRTVSAVPPAGAVNCFCPK